MKTFANSFLFTKEEMKLKLYLPSHSPFGHAPSFVATKSIIETSMDKVEENEYDILF